MELDIHSSIPERKDWRIGCIGSGFIMSDCHLVAYGKAGFNPVAIASRTKDNATKCAEQHKIGSVYDSIDQLLDDESIEVLDIDASRKASRFSTRVSPGRAGKPSITRRVGSPPVWESMTWMHFMHAFLCSGGSMTHAARAE